jgi:uncharacterized protein (TIGR02145 family)
MNSTNESGFSGLPSGSRDSDGEFIFFGSFGTMWSSLEFSSIYFWFRQLKYNTGNISRGFALKTYGFSVRCIKD